MGILSALSDAGIKPCLLDSARRVDAQILGLVSSTRAVWKAKLTSHSVSENVGLCETCSFVVLG